MKNIAYLFLVLAVSGLMACGGQHQHGEGGHDHDGDHAHHDDHDHDSENDAGAFGAAISKDNPMNIDDLISKVSDDQPVKATVKATVSEVCQKKGCWMTLNRADGKTMRVTFKDYGFFVPMDISGKEVIIEGEAKVEITEVDVLKHFAEDAGKSKAEIDAITEPESEVVFEAEGVIVL